MSNNQVRKRFRIKKKVQSNPQVKPDYMKPIVKTNPAKQKRKRNSKRSNTTAVKQLKTNFKVTSNYTKRVTDWSDVEPIGNIMRKQYNPFDYNNDEIECDGEIYRPVIELLRFKSSYSGSCKTVHNGYPCTEGCFENRRDVRRYPCPMKSLNYKHGHDDCVGIPTFCHPEDIIDDMRKHFLCSCKDIDVPHGYHLNGCTKKIRDERNGKCSCWWHAKDTHHLRLCHQITLNSPEFMFALIYSMRTLINLLTDEVIYNTCQQYFPKYSVMNIFMFIQQPTSSLFQYICDTLLSPSITDQMINILNKIDDEVRKYEIALQKQIAQRVLIDCANRVIRLRE